MDVLDTEYDVQGIHIECKISQCTSFQSTGHHNYA